MSSFSLRLLYRDEFETFDPMTADVDPDEFAGELRRIVSRARKCLKDLTNEQVEAIAEFADIIVSACIVAGKVISTSPDGSEKPLTTEAASDVDERDLVKIACAMLQEIIAAADDPEADPALMNELHDLIEIDQVTSRSVHAAHALVQCVRATENSHVDWLSTVGVHHLIVACECVSVAELDEAHRSKSSEELKVILSSTARNAARSRWQKWEPARQRAVEIYRSRDWVSRAQAVRAMKAEIMQLVESKIGERLSDMNAEKTIESWIRKDKR